VERGEATDDPPPAAPGAVEPGEAESHDGRVDRDAAATERAPGPPWSRWARLLAGALVVLGLILAVRHWPRGERRGRLHVTAADGSGASAPLGAVIGPGSDLRAGSGRLCGRVEPEGVFLCLAPGSAARLERSTGADLRVALLRGRLVAALGARPPGARFVVVTPLGEVTSLDAVFSVSVTDAAVIIAVIEGRVDVPAARNVVEGERLSLPRGWWRPSTAGSARAWPCSWPGSRRPSSSPRRRSAASEAPRVRSHDRRRARPHPRRLWGAPAPARVRRCSWRRPVFFGVGAPGVRTGSTPAE
jgi:hypothetical protein